VLKEAIAKHAGIAEGDLNYFEYLFNPAPSGEYLSMTIAGLVGAYLSGSLLYLLGKAVSPSNNSQG
jgi:hypothetical protein